MLEEGHGSNALVNGDNLGHLRIHASREQFRCGSYNREPLPDRDEIVQLALAIGIAAGDTHHIIRVQGQHICILPGKFCPHSLSSIFAGTKNYGLGHPVSGLQVFGYLGSHLAYAVFQHDVVVIVSVVIDPVRNLLTVIIQLSLDRAPAITDIHTRLNDPEGSQEAIIDALIEAVGVDRIPKVIGAGYILCLLRRSGHAYLGSCLEVFQHPAPLALFFSRSTVALIYDDEVEELRLKQLLKMRHVIIAYHLLIKGEVYLIGRDLRRLVL